MPGSPVLADHPKNVYLPEAPVLEQLHAWLGHLFDPARRRDTVAALLDSQGQDRASTARASAERRLADAERRLRRLQEAIKAGVDLLRWSSRSTRRKPSGKRLGPSWPTPRHAPC
ncbi:hypothetical protein GCM10023108_35250 [Saccharopolyspora hordei]